MAPQELGMDGSAGVVLCWEGWSSQVPAGDPGHSDTEGVPALGIQVPAGDPGHSGTDEEAVVRQPSHLGKHNGSSIWTIKNAMTAFSRSCFPSLF